MKRKPPERLTMDSVLSRAALMAALGIAWKTLDRWIEAGCPVHREGGLGDDGEPVEWQFVLGDIRRWFNEYETTRWVAHRHKGEPYACRIICFFCGRMKPDTEFVTHAVCKSCRAEHVAKYDRDYDSESELASEAG
jgi:hypothetical protein